MNVIEWMEVPQGDVDKKVKTVNNLLLTLEKVQILPNLQVNTSRPAIVQLSPRVTAEAEKGLAMV